MAPEVVAAAVAVDAETSAVATNQPDVAGIESEAAAVAEESQFVPNWDGATVYTTGRHRFRYVTAPSGFLVRPDSYMGSDFEVASLADIVAVQPGGAS